MNFETKDSGERAAFDSGMVRDVQAGKPRYGLIPLEPLKRLAELYARGAEKYDARNWEKADSVVELERFRESAFRHLMQLLAGETDEDHGAAVVFNVFAIMWLEPRLASPRMGRTVTVAELDAAKRSTAQPAGMVFGGARLPSVPDVAGRDLRGPMVPAGAEFACDAQYVDGLAVHSCARAAGHKGIHGHHLGEPLREFVWPA